MFLKETLPFYLICTKGYGVSIREIYKSCPVDMQPYVDAYKKESEEKQAYLHLAGVYFMDAIRASVCNQLAGKGHKPYEYPNKPYGIKQEVSRKQQAEQLFAELKTMQINFELSKKKEVESC